MSDQRSTTHLHLSRAERWLLHTAMLDRLGYGTVDTGETEPCVGDLALLEKLEDGRSNYSLAELERLRAACLAHINCPATHARDRSLASDLVESFNRELPPRQD